MKVNTFCGKNIDLGAAERDESRGNPGFVRFAAPFKTDNYP